MKTDRFHLLLIIAGLLLGEPSLLASEAATGSYLAFACDGTVRERRFLHQESATWIVNQNRAIAPDLGQAVYKVRVGRAQLDRLRLEVNLVPYRLEVSGDGSRWETLVSEAALAPEPMKFTTQDVSFTDAQRAAAAFSGCAWFRFRSAGQYSVSNIVQLKYFRLDVRGAEQPPYFVRNSGLRGHASLAVGLLMVLVGVVPVSLLWRRWGATWRVWAAGAALWAASVALKFGLAALVSFRVVKWLYATLSSRWAEVAIQGYTGLLTGIFECGIFLVVARAIKRKQWRWGEALALGLGFGAIEAVVTGLLVTASSGQPGTWDCLATWSDVPVAAFERLLALLVHAASVVMILWAFTSRQWGWFAASFGYKTAVDGLAAWVMFSGLGLFSSPWLMESLCFGPFALAGLLVLLYFRRNWQEEPGFGGKTSVSEQRNLQKSIEHVAVHETNDNE
jgi:uncharacterized membrane protein YhfC